jgi:hypothetical protein
VAAIGPITGISSAGRSDFRLRDDESRVTCLFLSLANRGLRYHLAGLNVTANYVPTIWALFCAGRVWPRGSAGPVQKLRTQNVSSDLSHVSRPIGTFALPIPLASTVYQKHPPPWPVAHPPAMSLSRLRPKPGNLAVPSPVAGTTPFGGSANLVGFGRTKS